MKVKEIFDLGVELGVKADFRGEKAVKKILERRKKEYNELPAKKKKDYDRDGLKNPYLDSGIYVDLGKNVKKVMVGVDIETAEVLLADRLGDIDLVIAHHPLGKGLAALGEVMDMQADVLNRYGVPINVAEHVLKPRIAEVSRGVAPINHYQSIDSAKLLKVQLMNLHTPCDNLVAKFLEDEVTKTKPETVGDVLETLKKIPEYAEAAKIGSGPRIFNGEEKSRVGKIAFTELTGGTEGSKEIYEKMAQAGIGTVIAMHQSEEHKKQAEKAHINVIIAGHIASDSVGINLFLDELEKKGVKVVPCSGLIRISRVKK